ncbi:MAG TPA: alpha/beta hydrolase, partial [Chloroflexota bacterium]
PRSVHTVVARAGRFLLATTLAAALAPALAAGVVAYRAAHPPRRPPTRTPADLGLPLETVRFLTADRVPITAWLIPPRNGRIVVYLHGIGGNREQLLDRAAALAAHGYGALLLDLRAHGESGGTTTSFGVREAHDVTAALRFLRARYPSARLGALGVSLGGAAALFAASQTPHVEALVVDSAFAALEPAVRKRMGELTGLPSWLGGLVVRWAEWQTGVKAAAVAPLEVVERIAPRPLLLIHGEDDRLFPVDEHAVPLYRRAGEPRALWTVAGADHAAPYVVAPETYVERVRGFFDRSLGREPPEPPMS